MIELGIKLDGFERALRRHDPRIVQRAGVRTMRETTRSARTAASKSIRSVFNIRASDLNKELRSLKVVATGDLVGIIEAKGRPINLIKFGARWERGRRVTTGTKSFAKKRATSRSGVSVRIHKGKTTVLQHAFIARGRRGSVDGAGGLFVFQRSTDKRYPIENRASITSASMMMQQRVLRDVGSSVADTWGRRFPHHLERLLK